MKARWEQICIGETCPHYNVKNGGCRVIEWKQNRVPQEVTGRHKLKLDMSTNKAYPTPETAVDLGYCSELKKEELE